MISLELKIGDHTERIDFGVTNLGKGEIFLGHDWLKRHNPSIDWTTGKVTFNAALPNVTPIPFLIPIMTTLLILLHSSKKENAF